MKIKARIKNNRANANLLYSSEAWKFKNKKDEKLETNQK
jgi:hypothetical protein